MQVKILCKNEDIVFMLIGTSGTGHSLMVIVAVPLYTVVELFGIDINCA
ncbi:hypothetical protein BH18THE2_BH18THE2_28420 [soil metagenome]